MNEFIETLKSNIQKMENDYLAQGKAPLSMADKTILDQNNVTVEEFIEQINPHCTVITQHVISDNENKLSEKGIPEGSHVRVFMIVGHDEETKQLLWSVHEVESALYDSNYLMNQLLLFSGTKVIKSKVYITTSDGPIAQENTY